MWSSRDNKRTKSFDPMKRGIIGVVEVMGPIHRGSAKEDNIFSLDLKINVLKANMLVVLIAEVHKIGDNLPMLKIPRTHQGKQISGFLFFGGIDSGRDRVIAVRLMIVLDHEF